MKWFFVAVLLFALILCQVSAEAEVQFTPPRELLENENVLAHLRPKAQVEDGDHVASVGYDNSVVQDAGYTMLTSSYNDIGDSSGEASSTIVQTQPQSAQVQSMEYVDESELIENDEEEDIESYEEDEWDEEDEEWDDEEDELEDDEDEEWDDEDDELERNYDEDEDEFEDDDDEDDDEFDDDD
jgi:hypothetical protein